MDAKTMVETYQCPGCVAGSDTGCGSFRLTGSYGVQCGAHSAGTSINFTRRLFLGMPRGFNKFTRDHGIPEIRLWPEGAPVWDNLNIPVWRMVVDGVTFVRTYMPRVGLQAIDVIAGPVDVPPVALDVADFIDDID